MNINIIGYRDELATYFTEFNLAWLRKYFVVEPLDFEMLSDPKSYIIDKNGFIYFAEADGEIAGTFALIKINEGVYELSKMAVEERFIGKKIGNIMLQFCLEEAKRLGATKLELVSNRKLKPAIHLYRKFGFEEVPLLESAYDRADIKMELNLDKS